MMIINGDVEKILGQINGRLDMGMAGALKEYLYPYDEYNTLNDKLDEIIENQMLPGFNHDMLIYPAKNKTDEIYPNFLCICRDETRLSTALSKIRMITDKMVNKYGDNSSPLKNVMLITDKWDRNTFDKYKNDFLYKAKVYNIWFVILLICGEELQQIPFLPNDVRHPDALPGLNDIEMVQNNRKEISYLMDEFTYEVHPSTLDQFGGYTYRFDLRTGDWRKEDVAGEYQEGRIPKPSFDKFMRNIRKLMDEKSDRLISESNSCDDMGYVLHWFDKDISWTYSDTETNPDFKRLQQIIDEFIQKCEKKAK